MLGAAVRALRQARDALAERNAALAAQALEMRALGERLVRAQEDEQRRVALELQGELEQGMTALGTRLGLLARTPLGGRPDYVRHVPITNEIWVTEPAEQRIEVLRFAIEGGPDLETAAFIPIGDGPEGLVFDNKRERAFIHHYLPKIGVIDVRQRRLLTDWKTACESSHGIPIVDEARGLLFAGCRDRAKVTVLSIDHPGGRDETSAIADRDELERAFGHLAIEQRAVFVLHHYLGLPLVEIADLLGIPAGTARSRLHYAIAGLSTPKSPAIS